MSSTAGPPLNLADYERLAALRADPIVWDYIQGGSDDELTLRANREAFARLTLHPRVLAAVDTCDLSTTVLGTPLPVPILIAPTGLHKLVHADGEHATARAAAASGALMVVSTMSTVAVEDLARAGGPLWFQLYILKDRKLTTALVRRAEAAGCRALVVTVDAPRLGRRERDLRNRFALPSQLVPAHVPVAHLHDAGADRSSLAAHARSEFEHALGWDTIAWLRSLTSLPIVLKGILTAEDARHAQAAGVQGIIVSNHGGRQLDGVPAAIDALAEVVAAAGACEVFLDGGVRRGTDVLKARALGARAVLIGRPVLWGLLVDGAEGVAAVLEQLRSELELSMALSGRARWRDVDGALVRRSPQ
jgi:4-hydroxymandelate oxidase